MDFTNADVLLDQHVTDMMQRTAFKYAIRIGTHSRLCRCKCGLAVLLGMYNRHIEGGCAAYQKEFSDAMGKVLVRPEDVKK